MTETRRRFLLQGIGTIAALTARASDAEKGMPMKPITIPPLPYPPDALAPHISARTVEYHYGKHQAAYANALKALLAAGNAPEADSLPALIRAARQCGNTPLYNNAAQLWNHIFYWESLAPVGTAGNHPSERLEAAIGRDFGSREVLVKALADAAVKQFGSGWAWLVARGEKVEIRATSNADSPLIEPGLCPLATVDVWEHAYYLDWQNRRADYAATLCSSLLDWRRISERFERAVARQA
ncbi:MAG: superoxide dismutase [Kiritimatiellia bacterium]|nr:superoxide dismutase [Kiritimatiellia bacterium]